MMPVIPAQSRTQHHQVEPALADRRFHRLPPHGLLHRVSNLLQCRSRNRLFLSVPFTIKNFQLRCFRHECVSSPFTVATPHPSEYITEDQQQPGPITPSKTHHSKSSSPPPISALHCLPQRGLPCSALASWSPFFSCRLSPPSVRRNPNPPPQVVISTTDARFTSATTPPAQKTIKPSTASPGRPAAHPCLSSPRPNSASEA